MAASDAPPARRRLSWEDVVGAVTLAAMALITFANVLARYFTDQSFAWTEEISIALMVVLTLVAASAAVVRDRHIRIEALFSAGTPTRRLWLARFSAAMTLLAFVVLAVLASRLAWDDFQYEVTSPGIGVPQWWYTITLPVLAAVVALRALQRLVKLLRRSPGA
jgi:TRAP-type C4-dicarboxylate transport system permease small subunit